MFFCPHGTFTRVLLGECFSFEGYFPVCSKFCICENIFFETSSGKLEPVSQNRVYLALTLCSTTIADCFFQRPKLTRPLVNRYLVRRQMEAENSTGENMQILRLGR